MAKKKEESTAPKIITMPAVISAAQYYEEVKNRKIIPVTPSLDVALSGGFPRGGTILVGGDPKVGKTTLILRAIASAQRLYNPDIYYMNIENRQSLGKVFRQIEGLQIDNPKFRVVRPSVKIDESTGQQVGSDKATTEWWLERTSDIIAENPYAIIVWDSFAALCSESQFTNSAESEDRGKGYKTISNFFRQHGDMLTSNCITLFIITQIIANTSGYGRAKIEKVANAIKHNCDAWLFLSNAGAISNNKEEKIGSNVKIRIEESAFGKPFGDAEIPLVYGSGVDVVRDLISMAIIFAPECVSQAGAWYYFFGNKDNNEQSCNGLPAAIKYVKENPSVGYRIDLAVRKCLLEHIDWEKSGLMKYYWEIPDETT